MDNSQKTKGSGKGFFRFLFSLYHSVKFLTAIMVFFMAVSRVAHLLKFWFIIRLVDLPFADGFVISDLYVQFIIIFSLYAIELIGHYTANILRTIVIYKKQNLYIAQKMFSDLKRKEYKFFADNHSGKIASSVNEVGMHVRTLNHLMMNGFVTHLATLVTNIAILVAINLVFFSVASVLFSLIIITRIIYFSKTWLPLTKEAQVNMREYNGSLNDSILNFTTLKVYNSVDNCASKLQDKKRKSVRYSNRAMKHEFSYGAVVNVIYIVVFAFVVWYGIEAFSEGRVSLGDLVFFVNVMIACKMATTSLSWNYIQASESLVMLKNIYELLYLNNNAEHVQAEELSITQNSIQFKDVTFKYNTKNVFENLNLEVSENKKLGIIGVSGSGKTTIVNLLLRFYQPQGGSILIGGKDIKDYSKESLYENITYVPQEIILMHDTIMENIKIAKPSATEDEVFAAAQKAELHDFILGLDDKYQTVVGERGVKLSGGQKQRIALARIFLRNAKIIVFDEATSSLDNDTEFKIQSNINKFFNNHTILSIAHRLSTLEEMDEIIVLENGKVLDKGKPSYILKKYKSFKDEEEK